MQHLFHCPECGREHDEPAEAGFVLTVRCLDCELVAVLRDRSATIVAVRPRRRGIAEAA